MDRQKSMFPELVPSMVFGDVRDKLLLLKNKYGDHVFEDDRFLALKFWTEFDGLRELLGHKYPVFIEWLVSVAKPLSSIERSRRKLTEEKLIPKNPNRKNVAKEYAKYWGNNEQT